ncbi:hypothetical protein [Streptomyces sp. NPDC087437]|uniref:hypothetical protein n=1 Tax=Streptomyces sp. NPDC087437 TaxID=3365789 RepID=UPI00380CD270
MLTAACGLLPPTANCVSPIHKRQFCANTTFSGKPKKTDRDSAVNENGGTGAPAEGLPKDTFGVRRTVTRNFGSGGPYAVAVAVQDGIRVYLDGTAWSPSGTTVFHRATVVHPDGTESAPVGTHAFT